MTFDEQLDMLIRHNREAAAAGLDVRWRRGFCIEIQPTAWPRTGHVFSADTDFSRSALDAPRPLDHN